MIIVKPLFSKKESKVEQKYSEIAQEYIEMTKMSKADSIRNNSLKESKKKQ